MFALAGATSVNAQVPKVPLVEHFTQASCGPCASQNPALKATLDAFGTANYVRVSHQVSWPGFDPMHNDFPAGPDDRVTYYGITGVPNTSLNGGAPGAPNTIVTSSTLSAAAALTTPYNIIATQSWNSTSSVTVNITVQNVTSSAVSLADKIYVTMVENTVIWPTPPGSNGETQFEFVMREMYNATTGAAGATTGAALASIPANGSLNFSITISSLPSYIRDKSEVAFAVYLQNNATKTIHQAGKTAIVPIAGLIDVAAVSASAAGAGYCDYSFNPVVNFVNNDATATVTSVVANYAINGGTPVQQTFSGSLAPGQSTNISFPATTLTPGLSSVSYTVLSVNGGQDWSSPAAISIATENFNKLNASGVPAPVVEGMESAPLIPSTGYSRELTTAIFEAPAAMGPNLFSIVDGPTYSYGNIGGFAGSSRSIRARFYDIAAGNSMKLILQKVDLGSSPALKFSHAYRQYSSENDKLEVFVSTDCGTTWTSVYNKSGATLSTLAPSTTSFIPSASTDWVLDNVNLSAYANMTGVVVKFQFTSDYGNNLWLDDINLLGTTASVETLTTEGFKIYPNPATDKVNVSFEAQNGSYVISIVDLTGRTLATQTLTNVNGAQVVEMPVNNLATGNYIVSIVNDGVKFTQKISVQ